MQITHLGHACLFVESGDTRILIDPGSFSSGFETLLGLDAILVTHQHPDHLDPERFDHVRAANPDARVLLEPETAGQYAGAEAFAAGDTATIGALSLTGRGGRHAIIHDKVAPIGNVGMLLSEDGGTTLFHPGDSYDDVPEGVDVLALPLSAPWAKVRETLDFVRAVGPSLAVPIHDATLSAAGRGMYLMHVSNFGETEVRDLHGAGAVEF